MSKKTTGFILSLMMILALIPALPAKADDAFIYVGDKEIDLTNGGSYMDGRVEYDASTHTLTLNDLEWSYHGIIIDARSIDFTIKGSAKLKNIRSQSVLGTFECNVILDGDFEFYAKTVNVVYVENGTLTVNGGSLYATATGDYPALFSRNTLILNNNETFVVGDIDAKEILIAQAGLVKFVNDDEDHTELQSGNVRFGETPQYKGETPAKEADAQYTYTFSGWTDGTETYGKDETLPSVKGDVTYTAVYDKTVNKYDLTFDLGGGTLNGKTGTYTMNCEYGAKINLPDAPTKEGYKFLYWKGSEYEAGAEYTVEGPHDFTAVWEAETKEEAKEQETSPKTGDSNQMMLWIALMAVALAGGIGILIMIYKRREQ